MDKNRVKKIGMVCAVSILCLGANAVVAGEITGNGKSLKTEDGTLHGKSDCAFSGLEDSGTNDGIFRGIRTQNWGQIPKELRDIIRSLGGDPGVACNPQRSTGEPMG
ncbi:MAG TPA: hypothetical protein VFL45_10145 [Gammaproteobacteria bacterium]|jgi:hypothetical protein|nr:hypothetical protein [Gammaproteobacteria bacterium]HET7588425.1 hypothetical protein [Gammaproteobacteria bacterium]